MDILKSLGIGQKNSYQLALENNPVLSALTQRRSPTAEETQRQHQINEASGVTLPRYEGTLRSGEKIKNIGGISYVVPVGDTSVSGLDSLVSQQFDGKLPMPVSQQFDGKLPMPDMPGVFSPPKPFYGIDMQRDDTVDDNMRGGFEGSGEFSDGTLINTSGYDVSQDPIKNTVNSFVQTLTDKAQSVKAFAEKQKQDYLDNRNKRMQVHASEMVMDMENQLMKDMMAKDKKRKQQEDLQQDYFDYMDLENQVQSANKQMDQANLTNFLLNKSGLFGQGTPSPSYNNPMQLTMSDTYAQPEYYSNPFEIKRLYE